MITGGKGTLAGPVVGGLIFGIVPEVLRALAIEPEAQWIAFGALMIAIVFLLPQGIVPAVRDWWESRARGHGARIWLFPSPRRGEGGDPRLERGEPGEGISALQLKRTAPLTPTLSPSGRGGARAAESAP